jgi:hypothetical protein
MGLTQYPVSGCCIPRLTFLFVQFSCRIISGVSPGISTCRQYAFYGSEAWFSHITGRYIGIGKDPWMSNNVLKESKDWRIAGAMREMCRMSTLI